MPTFARAILPALLAVAAPAGAQTASGGDPDLEGMPGLPESGGDPDLEGMPPPPDDGGDAGGMPPPPDLGGFDTGFDPTVRFGGRLGLKVLADTRRDREGEDLVESRGRLDLELAGRLTPEFSALVSGRMTHETRAPERDLDGARFLYEAELRDAWFTSRFGATVLTIGNQTIRWGTADANSPNDVINPVDYREGLVADFETPLIPVLAARATHTVLLGTRTLTFEGVYVPFFAPHRVALFGTDWAPVNREPQFAAFADLFRQAFSTAAEEDIQPLLVTTDPPDESPRNGSAGARVAWAGSGFDLRLNAFYGWDRVPELVVDPILLDVLQALAGGQPPLAALAPHAGELQKKLEAGDELFATRHHRQLVLGADGVVVLGDFAFKGDVAWSPERTLYTEDLRPVRPAVLSWAGGVDYMPSTSFNVTVEVFGLRALDDPPPGTDYLFIGRNFVNVVGLVRWMLFDDDLTLQLSGQYGISKEDFLIAPLAAWRVVEGHEVAVGALLLEGPDESTGGVFDANDHVFARYVHAF